MDADIQFKNAKEFSKAEIAFFKEILLNAGEVSKQSFDGLIGKNPKLLFIGNPMSPKGIGALKSPNDSYKNRIFAAAESSSNPKDFNSELGWVVSLQKGNGKRIMKVLSEIENVYATVREENHAMIYLLEQNGFQREGNPYASKDEKYKLMLFLRRI